MADTALAIPILADVTMLIETGTKPYKSARLHLTLDL